MKLLRVGEVGNEIPAALDDNGVIRDLSDQIEDLLANNEELQEIQKII